MENQTGFRFTAEAAFSFGGNEAESVDDFNDIRVTTRGLTFTPSVFCESSKLTMEDADCGAGLALRYSTIRPEYNDAFAFELKTQATDSLETGSIHLTYQTTVFEGDGTLRVDAGLDSTRNANASMELTSSF